MCTSVFVCVYFTGEVEKYIIKMCFEIQMHFGESIIVFAAFHDDIQIRQIKNML